MRKAARDIGLVCWACGGICDGSDRAGLEQRAERAEAAFLKVVQNEVKMGDAILRAERFARLWKRMAKTLMDRSWYQHGHKHGVAEERARIVELVRGMMCKDDVGDCDLCIAYLGVITTIEANP